MTIDELMSHTKGRKTGMLLIGHGTRDRQGIDEFLSVAQRVDQLLPDVPVAPGFLELAEPRIDQAVAWLIAESVSDVVIVPLLLFAAGHATQDIPNAVIAASRNYGDLRLQQAEPLGCHKKIVEQSAERFAEALADNASENATNVMLIMVGRGSSDELATAEMLKFTDLRTMRTPVSNARTAFMAIAEPSVKKTLTEAAVCPQETIVVQPHLLFHGQLLGRLNDAVTEIGRHLPKKKWVVTDHLGASESIARVAVLRFVQAMTREGV